MLCAGSLFMAHFSFFVRLGNSFGFRSVVREAFLGAVYRSHGLLTGLVLGASRQASDERSMVSSWLPTGTFVRHGELTLSLKTASARLLLLRKQFFHSEPKLLSSRLWGANPAHQP
jgi:hypothetical protein